MVDSRTVDPARETRHHADDPGGMVFPVSCLVSETWLSLLEYEIVIVSQTESFFVLQGRVIWGSDSRLW